MPDKNNLSYLSYIQNQVGNWKDPAASSTGSKIIDSMRIQANQEIFSTEFQDLADVFGEKHRDFLSNFEKLSIMELVPLSGSAGKRTKELEPIAGKEVIGKIVISSDGIHPWIQPEVQNQGVILCDLHSAIRFHSNLIERVYKTCTTEPGTTLSNMVLSQANVGAFLYVPDTIHLDGVFIIEIDIQPSPNALYLFRLITLMGKSTNANLIIKMRSEKESAGKSIFIIQNDIILDDDSKIGIIQDQKVGKNSALFISERIREGKDSLIKDFILDQGSGILDRYLTVDAEEEGGEAQVTALYQMTNNQSYYYDTHQKHRSSHTKSDLLFKGVLRMNSYSHWMGNILVAKDTVGANGYQANNNLLLGDSAKAESIPGLEILTDDVKCSHGVTMGNIDKNQMFYLQSRGINKMDAENLIVSGFLLSAIKRINDPDLEDYVQTLLGD